MQNKYGENTKNSIEKEENRYIYIYIKYRDYHKMKRSYRERVLETPSHTPGLDKDAEERIIKKRKEQHHGINITSSSSDNNNNNNHHHHHHHHRHHSNSRNDSDSEEIQRSGIGTDTNEWERPERLSTIRTASNRSIKTNNTPSSSTKNTPITTGSNSNNKWIMSSSIKETSGNEWERTPTRRNGSDNTWEQMNKSYNIKNEDFDRSFYLVYIFIFYLLIIE